MQSRPGGLARERFMIAGIQMNVPITGDNVEAMLQQIDNAVALFPGIEMVVFSELAAHGPLRSQMAANPTVDEKKFQDAAAKHGIWLIPGTMFIERDGLVYNQAIVINPTGNIVGRYDKMFPFTPFEAGIAGGNSFLVFDVPEVGRFGVSICYDIWFPETSRTLTSYGVEVLLHPVLTGTTDRHAEIAIAQATAAMFQCYVVDVNGLDAGGKGLSLITEPTGRIVYQAGQTAEIFPVVLDLGLVRQIRCSGGNGLGQTLKSWRDRACTFPLYSEDAPTDYLASLGPLVSMRRP